MEIISPPYEAERHGWLLMTSLEALVESCHVYFETRRCSGGYHRGDYNTCVPIFRDTKVDPSCSVF